MAGIFRSNYNTQRGSGDSFAIIGVLVICCVLSAVVIVLNWVKTTKEARIQRDFDNAATKGNIKRQPRGYQVIY
ncbi:MAG: hypothetical protein J5J00_07905 [Deltaproteobacteria bacterium]|nr:hypothetical protein [Deltaproteobacteria bacterium]